MQAGASTAHAGCERSLLSVRGLMNHASFLHDITGLQKAAGRLARGFLARFPAEPRHSPRRGLEAQLGSPLSCSGGRSSVRPRGAEPGSAALVPSAEDKEKFFYFRKLSLL